MSSDVSQVRQIWAVGRNYAKHARELGNPVPSQPLIFLKAPGGLICGSAIEIPLNMGAIHFETEACLQLGRHLEPAFVGLCLDLTAREQQNHLKKQGAPWTLAKAFKNSCPISELIPYPGWGVAKNWELSLNLNGQIKQRAQLKDMTFSPEELISFLREKMPLLPYDLVLTGTPAGVGLVQPGDVLKAQLGRQISHQWNIVSLGKPQ